MTTVNDVNNETKVGSDSSSSVIPVIDIGPYLDGSDKEGVAAQVGKACEEIGFFMIQNHGIDIELLSKVQSVATNFFDQSLDEKQKYQAPFGLGYMGEGIENVAATLDTNENKSRVDTKESLNLTLPVRDEVWPPKDDVPMLRDVCETYYKSVEHLANQLMCLFALALKLDEHFFDDKVNQAYTTLRLLNYPAQEVPKDNETDAATIAVQTRNAEHTDYGTLTILWSPDSRGLQAQSRDGVWMDVIAPRECFIINIGDLMMNWTNDLWISTLHRVVPHPDTLGQRRFSVPFFHNPNPNAMIECIESCHSSENPPKYEPMLAKTHLERKVSKALGKEETMTSDLSPSNPNDKNDEKMPIYACRDVWEQMNNMLSNTKMIRNFHRCIDMSNGSYTVTTDLFPSEALVVYSSYNLGDDVSKEDSATYFSAHRGGSQGDYREGMKDKIANVVDCLKQYPLSKRAVITIPNTSFPSHTSDDDAKCMREIHFYLDETCTKEENKKMYYTLNATVWMRAQAAEIFPKNIHFVGSLMDRVSSQLTDGSTTVVMTGTLFYLATTLVSVRDD